MKMKESGEALWQTATRPQFFKTSHTTMMLSIVQRTTLRSAINMFFLESEPQKCI